MNYQACLLILHLRQNKSKFLGEITLSKICKTWGFSPSSLRTNILSSTTRYSNRICKKLWSPVIISSHSKSSVQTSFSFSSTLDLSQLPLVVSVGICKYKPGYKSHDLPCYEFECSHWWKIYLKKNPLHDFLSSLNAVISIQPMKALNLQQVMWFITRLILKFQLKTTFDRVNGRCIIYVFCFAFIVRLANSMSVLFLQIST